MQIIKLALAAALAGSTANVPEAIRVKVLTAQRDYAIAQINLIQVTQEAEKYCSATAQRFDANTALCVDKPKDAEVKPQ